VPRYARGGAAAAMRRNTAALLRIQHAQRALSSRSSPSGAKEHEVGLLRRVAYQIKSQARKDVYSSPAVWARKQMTSAGQSSEVAPQPLFGPYTASCFPFLDPSSNCCAGGSVGAFCDSREDCRGLSVCTAGICTGESGCEAACNVRINGQVHDCCAPEAVFSGRCSVDADCQGARYCSDSGFCAGDSGCVAKASGQKVIYDRECVCTQMGSFCSYSQGLPCADGCSMWSPSPGTLVCSRLETFASSEDFFTIT
jgi:hypothetical protein